MLAGMFGVCQLVRDHAFGALAQACQIRVTAWRFGDFARNFATGMCAPRRGDVDFAWPVGFAGLDRPLVGPVEFAIWHG